MNKIISRFSWLVFLLTSVLFADSRVVDNAREVIRDHQTGRELAAPEESGDSRVVDDKEIVRDHQTGRGVAVPGKLLEQISEIITIIKDRDPSLLRDVPKNRVKILNSFLSHLCPDARFSDTDNESLKQAVKVEDTATGEKKKEKIYPAVMIAVNRILYIRMDTFSDAALRQLRDDLRMSAGLAKKPAGLIFDLRLCHCINPDNVLKALSLVCPAKKLPETTVKLDKEIFIIPCAVLIGSKTSGSAEIFAFYLARAGKSLIFGEKSSGVPFAMGKKKLRSGGWLFLPEVPAFCRKNYLDLFSLHPDIPEKPYPVIPYRDISGKTGSEAGDACLQRASDLLISIEALKRRRKEKPAEKSKHPAE